MPQVELWPPELEIVFDKGAYERLVSVLYEEPQYLASMLSRAQATKRHQPIPPIDPSYYSPPPVDGELPTTLPP